MGRALPLALCLLQLGCAAPGAPRTPRAGGGSPGRCLQGEAWPEADAIFRGDARWHGGDAAYSVDLGGERTLWLFGDSFVASDPQPTRVGTTMIRNSVAIMRGRDPSTATLRFHFGQAADGRVASFFPEPGGGWYWPAHGVRVGGALVLFLYRMAADPTAADPSMAFAVQGSEVLRIDNPDAEPDAWHLQRLALDADTARLAAGASVFAHDRHLYVYAVQPTPPHDAYLLRWTLDALRADALPRPEAWTREGFGRGPPLAVMTRSAVELSVQWAARQRAFVAVYSQGFGDAPLVARFAAAPEGPFGPAREVFRPRVAANQIAYAGKAHPGLEGAELVMTYAVNSLEPGAVFRDESIYYPRFVKAQEVPCAR